MAVQVQLGFTADGAGAPFFTLDDAVQGVLDDSRWVLGGAQGLVDVTDNVRSVSISRGKSRELDRYQTGSAQVSFNNNLRQFDPTYTASPYFGQLVPSRQLVITVDGVVQFTGITDDWGIDYDIGGMSIAVCTGVDVFAELNQLTFTSYAPNVELTGTRIDNALTNVSWPAGARSIDTGNASVIDQLVDDGTNALSYLQAIAASEPGDVFATKDGKLRFVSRDGSGTSAGVTLGEDGISVNALQAVYGSELLYNSVTVSNASTMATAQDLTSIAAYGIRDLTIDTYLANDADLQTMADYLLAQYSNPEYRFESVDVILNNLSAGEKASLLALELGDFVVVKFTPSGIPPQIARAGKVIRLDQSHDPNTQRISIGLQTYTNPVFILDDLFLGKLDTSSLGW